MILSRSSSRSRNQYPQPDHLICLIARLQSHVKGASQGSIRLVLGIVTTDYNARLYHKVSFSKQPFPRQLNLSLRFSSFEATLAHTGHAAFAKLDFVLSLRKRARTMMGKMHAGEGVRAEVFVAACYEIPC